MHEQQQRSSDRRLFLSGIFQAIRCEEHCPRDPVSQEDYVFDRLCELMEEQQIDASDAQDALNAYLAYVRPDARVVHLGEIVSRPFYE